MRDVSIHLVSDYDIELLSAIKKEVMSRFAVMHVTEYLWPLTDNARKLQDIVHKIEKLTNNFVIYNIKDNETRDELKKYCCELKVPCVPALSRMIRELSSFVGEKPSHSAKEEYEVFTDDYFARVDAMNYVLSHDDGQNMWDLDEADIIIIGVSRTSKSPTSVYLSHKGYKTANIPFVNGIPLPETLKKMTNKLIVGLIINPDRLIEIRRNRLIMSQDYGNKNYATMDEILSEIRISRRTFTQNKWPIIDVTNRSVEEIAAVVIKNYQLQIR